LKLAHLMTCESGHTYTPSGWWRFSTPIANSQHMREFLSRRRSLPRRCGLGLHRSTRWRSRPFQTYHPSQRLAEIRLGQPRFAVQVAAISHDWPSLFAVTGAQTPVWHGRRGCEQSLDRSGYPAQAQANAPPWPHAAASPRPASGTSFQAAGLPPAGAAPSTTPPEKAGGADPNGSPSRRLPITDRPGRWREQLAPCPDRRRARPVDQ